MATSVTFFLSYDPLKLDFIAVKMNKDTHFWHGRCQWRYAPKCYYTCGHTIFMAWRYPLNNSYVIWRNSDSHSVNASIIWLEYETFNMFFTF